MDVYLCFDVEDLVHPDSDDVAMDIARLLSAEAVSAHMCIVGEKARLWERRGRRDVIAAVARHDVGLHTDHHSIHPTTSEYLADKGWEDGVAEAVRQEIPGMRDLERIVRACPSSWGTSGSSWGPQIPAATARLGIPSTIYAHVHAGDHPASWFASQLCFSRAVGLAGGEDALADERSFAAGLPRVLDELAALSRAGLECVGLFCGHPTRYRYTEFWDALNFARGENTPAERYRRAPRRPDEAYRRALESLRRMVLEARDLPGVTVRPLRDLLARFRRPAGVVAPEALADIARAVAEPSAVPPYLSLSGGASLSPAQALDLLAREALGGGAAPSCLALREVLGPDTDPPSLARAVELSAPETVAACREMVMHIDATSRLPARITAGDVVAGPGSFLRALARSRGEGTRRLEPGPELPEGAAERAAQAIDRRLPGWPPHRPDLRLDLLALHTRLQCWSLHPATVHAPEEP